MVEMASGGLVIVIGVLFLTNRLAGFAAYFSFLNDFALWLESFLTAA
jgi:hypothetical protein